MIRNSRSSSRNLVVSFEVIHDGGWRVLKMSRRPRVMEGGRKRSDEGVLGGDVGCSLNYPAFAG